MYLLTFLSALFLPLNNIGTKLNKTEGNAKILSITCTTCIGGALSWLVCFVLKERVTADMFLFAVLFALFFIGATLSALNAYTKGSLSATSLFGNASLVVVVLFSTFYFKEALGALSIVGVLGTLVSLALLSLPDEKTAGKRQGFNLVWLLLCLGMLLSNSLLSISSKLRQSIANGENAFAFMALCYSFTFVLSLLVYACLQTKKHTFSDDFVKIKQNVLPIAIQATGNTGSNLLVTYLASRVNATVLYPVNMGGGLVITVLCGFIFFKDKPNLKNIVGIIFGIVSLILLNL
ncbi:MAG: hypothetical protein J6K61_00735 [Clostridia bacterium]|nr:hypothetical protein [Clostridia bacterium]